MSWKEIYEEKLVSIEEAVKHVESGDHLWIGASCDIPLQMVEALCQRKDELKDVLLVDAMALAPMSHFKGEFKGHLNGASIFGGPIERKFAHEGNVSINSVNFSESSRALRDVYKINVLFVEAAEPDENGDMYFGPMGAAWNGAVAQHCDKVIIQINKNQKGCPGPGNSINVKDVTAICRFDHPLVELPEAPITEMEKKIAEYIIPYINNGDTLQIGVGGISNAVAYDLEHHKNLGIYTEMMTDSLVHLCKAGAVDKDRITIGFGLGTQAVYDYCTSGEPKMMDVSTVNQPHLVGQIDNFVSINNCIMVDLTGQVASESIGHRQFSSTGGQLYFFLVARISKGGKSFLCLRSASKDKEGNLRSSILLNFPPGQAVTTPRSCTMYVVTEYGVADLFNKSLKERAKAMIRIAHPDFREQLLKEAQGVGLIPEGESYEA